MYTYYIFICHYKHHKDKSHEQKTIITAFSEGNNMDSIWESALKRAHEDVSDLNLESIRLSNIIPEQNFFTCADFHNLMDTIDTIKKACTDKNAARQFAEAVTKDKYVQEEHRKLLEEKLM